jgi:anti-sigma factor RsiW
MNRCSEIDIREMLPDLLHGRLDADTRARIEAHIASCHECTEDLSVLRTVKSAAVFIPAIDVDRVVRQIPPYHSIVPVVQTPARSRAVSWLVAASLAIVVLGGGSLLMVQQTATIPQVVAGNSLPPKSGASPLPPRSTGVVASPNGTAIAKQPTHALALATGVDGLSDNGLRQLMNDMSGFDALPTTEPEPVIGDGLDQGAR